MCLDLDSSNTVACNQKVVQMKQTHIFSLYHVLMKHMIIARIFKINCLHGEPLLQKLEEAGQGVVSWNPALDMETNLVVFSCFQTKYQTLSWQDSIKCRITCPTVYSDETQNANWSWNEIEMSPSGQINPGTKGQTSLTSWTSLRAAVSINQTLEADGTIRSFKVTVLAWRITGTWHAYFRIS